MSHLFRKYDALGFTVLLTRRRSENKGCHHRKEQGRAEEGDPEIGIVHVASS
jgi:hypothetical protein